MACNQTLGGLVKDCLPNRGGVKNIYIGAFGALTVTVTNGKITALSLGASADKFKKYHFAKGSASVVTTPQFNDLGEYAGEQSVIAMTFGRMDTTKRVEMVALSVNENAVVVEDANGALWLYGNDQPVMRTGGTAQTGSEQGNTNGYTLELTDNSLELPYEIDGDVWTSSLWE